MEADSGEQGQGGSGRLTRLFSAAGSAEVRLATITDDGSIVGNPTQEQRALLQEPMFQAQLALYKQTLRLRNNTQQNGLYPAAMTILSELKEQLLACVTQQHSQLPQPHNT